MNQIIKTDLIGDAEALRVLAEAIQMTIGTISSFPAELQNTGTTLLLNQLERLCTGSRELKTKAQEAIWHE